MSCKFDKEIIQRYLDNEIDPLELIFLKEHLKYCDDCRKDIELLTVVDQELFNVFNNIELTLNLDSLAEKIVDQSIEDNVKRSRIGSAMHRGAVISKGIAASATGFVKYMPGSKLISRGISISTDYAGKSAKAFLKGRLKKIVGSIV